MYFNDSISRSISDDKRLANLTSTSQPPEYRVAPNWISLMKSNTWMLIKIYSPLRPLLMTPLLITANLNWWRGISSTPPPPLHQRVSGSNKKNHVVSLSPEGSGLSVPPVIRVFFLHRFFYSSLFSYPRGFLSLEFCTVHEENLNKIFQTIDYTWLFIFRYKTHLTATPKIWMTLFYSAIIVFEYSLNERFFHSRYSPSLLCSCLKDESILKHFLNFEKKKNED